MQPESVQDLFSRVAAENGRQVAIDRVARRLTYAELESRSNRIANLLLSGGLERSSPVAILAQDPIEVIASILGILKAGGVFVPLDPAFPVQRLELMARQVEPRWYLVESRFAGRAEAMRAGAGARVIALDGEELDRAPAERLSVASSPDDPCSIYFTSGSTGKPKAILGRLKGIAHFARWEAEALGVQRGTRVSQLASPSFDGFLKDAFVPLCAGGVVCAPESRSVVLEAPRLIDWVDVEGVEVLHCVPSVLRSILNEKLDAKYFADLKWVVLAGEALLPADVRRWREVFGDRVPLVNLYGPTETTVTKLCHFVTPADVERPSIPIGKPIPGAAAMILNAAAQPCRPGAVGEIYLRTPYRALGYYSDPERTREAFVPNPFSDDPEDLVYRTGDFGRLLEDGSFEFLGRRDHQVKIRGVRVELGEIENLLQSHAGVRDVVVVDVVGEDGTRSLCAYVVLDGARPAELREHLSSQLPELMVPSAFVEVQELPRTLSGKVDRKALPTLAQVQAGRAEPEESRPRTPVEEIVAGIWGEVLRLPRVGLGDNFFLLGGHSLLATQIISRVRDALEVELPLRALFEAPTVAELAAQIEREAGTARECLGPITPAPRQGILPLSYPQQRLWFLEQLAPGTAAFHIPLGMRLQRSLDVPALAWALGEVVRRHEILRTTFPLLDALPVQVIGPARELELPIVDLTGLADAGREREAWRLASGHLGRPFDLAAGPLVRTLLLRLDEEDHVLVCGMHHIVSDGWSRGVLIREVSALYAAAREGKPSPLPPLAIQYADFAVWQRRWLQGEALAAEIAHWKERLAGAPPVHRISTDRPRPAVQTYAGAREPVRLSPALSERLNALSRKSGTTLFMTLLAAFYALLCRYTGEEDHTLGTSVAGRTRADIEGLIGFFVNMLVLRTDCSGDPRFGELVKRVREMTLEAFAHQDLPFEALVEGLQPERNLSYPPLFQVALTLQNAPTAELALPGLTLGLLELDLAEAKYDLLMDLWESGDRISGALEHNIDLFDPATARRMVRHFDNLLAGAVADPERRISELPLLDDAERLQLLTEWNESRADYPRDRCAHHLFEELAASAPDAPAVVCGEESLARGELNCRADRLARHLRSLGVGRGDRVGLCLEHSLDEVVAVLAILKAGAGYVPLDPGHPAERRKLMLADAGVRVALTQQSLAKDLRESDDPFDGGATPDDIAYTIYTSGSTGEPKGVAVSHRALVNYIWWAREVYLRGESLGFPLYSSLAFDLTVTSVYTALIAGSLLVVYPRRGQEPPLEEILDDGRIGILKLTPSHLALIRDRDNRQSAVRRLIVGGEALTSKLAREIHQSFGGRVEIYNEYGPTEATVGCMIHRFDPADRRGFVPIGRPAANARVYVLDRGLNPVPAGAIAELYVAGDGLAQQYLHRQELTAEKLVPDPFGSGGRLYRTGDLARWLPEGILEFAGRTDEQVKLHGFRIELGEVESVLGRHPSLRECAVLLREDAPGDRRLVAYVVFEGGEPPSTSDLRRFLEEHLPPFMIPSIFLALEAFPRTPNGKADRRALPAPDGSRPELEAAWAPPETEMEHALAGIWKRVLRLDDVGIHDDFFHLGGQSILAAQVVQRINQRFRVSLPIRAIFGETTIAGLSMLVEETLIERLALEPELQPERN